MPYVERRGGAVSGLFANRQDGYAEEWLKESDPEVLGFRNPPSTVEELRAVTYKADTGRAALIAKLKTATPAQIDTYFAGRTTVAQIKADVVDIVKVLALAIRD